MIDITKLKGSWTEIIILITIYMGGYLLATTIIKYIIRRIIQ